MSGNSQRMWNWFSEIFLGVDGVDHSIRLSSRRFWVKLSDFFWWRGSTHGKTPAFGWMRITWIYINYMFMRRYLSVQEAMPVCFTVFLPTDVVVINDILFFGLSNGFRIMQNSSWTRCRHKPKVELKCFCNCFWLPVVANVSRIQSFAEPWEISRLTFKVIEVHHDTLVCVEARFRRLATSTQHGCFI